VSSADHQRPRTPFAVTEVDNGITASITQPSDAVPVHFVSRDDRRRVNRRTRRAYSERTRTSHLHTFTCGRGIRNAVDCSWSSSSRTIRSLRSNRNERSARRNSSITDPSSIARTGYAQSNQSLYSLQVDNCHDQFTPALETAVRRALAFLSGLEQSSVSATRDLADLRATIDKPLSDEGLPPDTVLNELVRDVEGGILGSAGGRFFGRVIGGACPASLGADWLTATWDQNAALYACGPAAAVVEEVAGRWLKELFGLPSTASFAFVSGCQMAHVTCLAAARHALLARVDWDVEARGLFGAPNIRVLSTFRRHGTIERAVRLLGFGRGSIFELEIDEDDVLNADALHVALNSGSPETLNVVILNAGDLNTGAFESFEDLIPVAHDHGAWVHVDGAFGLWAAASERYRHLVHGIDGADSWATDGHKWLNVPYDSGYAFVADAQSHRCSMSHRAAYLSHDSEARDQIDWNPEWSRRARGFATYAAVRQLGKNGIAALVDRCCSHTRSLVRGLGGLSNVQVLSEPIVNQGLVRFLAPEPDATDADHDRWTDDVISRVLKTGETFFGGTAWHGQRAMRVSVCNWMTSE
jgi:glutamate/tyrosine decarboxylase-like PLP-dependent enzyme